MPPPSSVRDAVGQALPDAHVPEIDRCVNKRLQEKRFSAAACVASVGGRVFHRSVVGCAVMPPPLRRLDASALFDLASLSKPLGAGLAALYLAGRGRLDLDAHISQVLRVFRDARFAGIRVDMLLDHTAGFAATPDFFESLRYDDARQHPSARRLGTAGSATWIQEKVAAQPLASTPGTATLYSDLGFMVLGWVIEEVVGTPLDVFLAKEVYEPLGLADDLFFVRVDDTDPQRQQRLARRTFVATGECPWRGRVLQGEVHDFGAWAMGGVAGHAGLFGTADAVWRLCQALLACYDGDSRLFHTGTLKRFWTRSRRVRPTTRTLAWDTPNATDSSAGKRFSRNSVGHLGFTGTSVWIDLSSRIIGVLLCNAVHPKVEGAREMLREFRPRMYDLIASSGDVIAPGKGKS